jgi:lysophospholipase L1-like esterase
MMKDLASSLLFWVLLPVSLYQGLRLRRTAPRLPEAAGNRTGSCGEGKELHLLAMGDSIIAGVGLTSVNESFPVQLASALANRYEARVNWRLAGRNGADIEALHGIMSELGESTPADIILISIGVNDVTGLTSKGQWRTRSARLLFELRRRWPKALVIFAGLPPMERFPLPPTPLRLSLGKRAQTLDRILQQVVSEHTGILHIATEVSPQPEAFCADGFHPNAESCEIWAAKLALTLEADNLLV